MNRLVIIWIFCIVFPFRIFPQILPVAFGEVSRQELESIPLPREKGASATVLCDLASTKMIYDNGFKIEFTRQIRIKIFKSSGYGLANIQIPYTKNNRIKDLKAFTYNIEDNQPVKVAVGQKQFYSEKVDPYHNMIRFTFPNIREGSVIEYSYTIIQNELWEYPGMRFQRTIPVRHVEYQASIPEFFQYTIYINQSGTIQFQQDVQQGHYIGLPVDIHIYRWSGDNLPAYEPEPLMPESEEYLAGVDFTLASVNIPDGVSYVASPTYDKLSEELLELNVIGQQIDNTLLFAGKVRKIIGPQDSPLKKMQAIYDYVQKHMNWNGYEQMWPDRSLAKAGQEGTGTNAEINLILLNMLRTAGIPADPVVLGTRDKGHINPRFAMAGRLNYLICHASIDGKDYLLDATDKFRPAGMLPLKCLNGQGWLLSKARGRWVKLLNNEKYATQEYYDLTLTEKAELTGHAIVTFSGYDAVNLRRLIHNEGAAGFSKEEIAPAGNLTVSNLKFGNLDSLYLPLQVTFDITFRHTLKYLNNTVFFKPLISIFGDYVNPWIKAERIFPVDNGCPSSDNLNCRIRLPDNYKQEELPKNIKINMPDNDASFIFGTESVGNNLNIAFELNVSKIFFETEEYPAFREFYTRVNKKCNEMVILKTIDNN
jgi:hypothetical protein